MAWIETTSGRFERPLGGTELGMLAALAGDKPQPREWIKIHCVAEFSTTHSAQELPSAFKEAWKALRLLKSPDIATSFSDRKKIYTVPSPQEIETWADETFILTETGKSVNDAVRDMQTRPSFLPCLSLLPQSVTDGIFRGKIIFYISHWRTEAAGVLKMINQIFDYAEDLLVGDKTRQNLEKHVQGSEIRLLTPTLDDVLMPDREASPEAKARVAKDFADYYSKFPPIDFPMHGELQATPSYMKVNQRTYTPDSTSNLVRGCKSEGVSVTAAVHSAFLAAVWEHAEGDKKKLNYVSMMPAQVRTRLPHSSPYRDQGCWDSARMLLLNASPDQNFSTRAHQLKQQYSRAATDAWMYDDIRQIPIEMMSPPINLPPSPPSLPWFTSIGVLENEVIVPEHGSIKVDYVTFWADATVPGIVLRLWTFRQRLNIQIQWNAAFHSDEIIQKTLDIIDNVLRDELHVKIETERSDVEEYNG